jgi:hypothetical protein
VPLYPIAEFRTVARRAVRRGGFTLLFAFGTVVLFAFTAMHLADRWASRDVGFTLLLVWVTIAAAAGTLVCEVRWKLARHPFTRCPHCRGRLTDSVPLTIASGCCTSCGVRVLEPPAPSPPDGLISRPEYLAADTAYQRRVVPLILGGVFASYAGFCGALGALDHLRLPDPLPFVVTLAVAVVAPVSLIAILNWMAAVAKRNPALACPACGRLLTGARMVVAATGHCHQCGCRAIVPRTRPLPPPHRRPPWTVAEIDRTNRLRRKWYWWAAGLTLAAGVVVPMAYALGRLVASRMELPVRIRLGWRFGELVYHAGPVLVAAVTGLAVVVIVPRWVLRFALRRLPLDCPRCGREFLPAFARATKCCSLCGWRIVADPPSPPAESS